METILRPVGRSQYRPSAGCGLCHLTEVESGKDALFYSDSYSYIVRNGNTHLVTSEGVRFARLRLSLTIRQHRSEISREEEEYLRRFFSAFIGAHFDAEEGRDFFFAITMRTYPQHWHIHAYFPPLSAEQIQVAAGLLVENGGAARSTTETTRDWGVNHNDNS